MKQFLTLFALACLPFLAGAQCDIPVASNAVVIDTDGAYAIVGPQWVCAGVTATLESGFVSALIEVNANVTAISNLGVYAVRMNSTLTISGLNNNIYHDPTATIIDNGINTMLTSCPDLAFDYTDAPAAGCDLTMHVGTLSLAPLVAFPNPAVDVITLGGNLPSNARFAAYDVQGALVASGQLEQGRIDLSAWPAGLYHVQAWDADGTSFGKVRVAKAY